MVKGLYTAATGMINEQKRVDVVANNLANASSAGFKAEGATSETFKEVLALKIKDSSEPGTARRLGGMNPGVKIGETYVDYSEGEFQTTNNVLDMAISGSGFFAIEFTNKAGETKTMYTRDGKFITNGNNELVNKNGDYVLDSEGKHIVLEPLTEISMDTQGNIYQNGAVVAQVGLTDFEDYNYLEKYGETYFQTVEGATEQAATGQIHSGMIESSNVQTVKEMVNLISYQRAYEANQKMIQAHDDTLGIATTELGKV